MSQTILDDEDYCTMVLTMFKASKVLTLIAIARSVVDDEAIETEGEVIVECDRTDNATQKVFSSEIGSLTQNLANINITGSSVSDNSTVEDDNNGTAAVYQYKGDIVDPVYRGLARYTNCWLQQLVPLLGECVELTLLARLVTYDNDSRGEYGGD